MSTKKITPSVSFAEFLNNLSRFETFKKSKEVAKILEISPQRVGNYKTRGNIPLDVIVSYALKNKRSLDQLLGIEIVDEEMVGKSKSLEGKGDPEGRGEPICTARGQALPVVYMPYYRHEKGKMYENLLVELDAEWLRQAAESREGLVSFIMDADNMVPTINVGDPIIISTQQNQISGAGIYAFSLEGRLIVRRVAPALDGGLLVTNDNPAYVSANLHTSKMDTASVLGRVLWKTTRV